MSDGRKPRSVDIANSPMYFAHPVMDYNTFLLRLVHWLKQIDLESRRQIERLERNKKHRKWGRPVEPEIIWSKRQQPFRVPIKGNVGNLKSSIYDMLLDANNHPFRGLGSYSVEEVLFLAGELLT